MDEDYLLKSENDNKQRQKPKQIKVDGRNRRVKLKLASSYYSVVKWNNRRFHCEGVLVYKDFIIGPPMITVLK